MKQSLTVSLRMVVCIAALLGASGMFLQTHAQVAQVNGTVKLKQADGTEVPLTNGLKIGSESTVKTAQNSSAVVSLGKLGRVEVASDTTMKLSYDSSTYTLAMLSRGRVRVSTAPGVTVTVTTPEGAIVSDAGKRTVFVVDTTCGDTFASVSKGSVELRAGNSVKQIAAGGQDRAGTATPGCARRE